MADVESDIKDWSGTTSSNKPTDSTTIGAGLADNFQQIQATVKNALNSKGSDIASATTTDLGATVGLYHDITGTTTITGFGTTAATGQWKLLQFDGALQITYNATSMILPGNANITTAAGDMCMVIHEGSGNWRMLWYTDDSTVPQLLDEDDMASDSAVSAATQQSIKAYVDAFKASFVVKRKASPQSVSASTTLQSDDDLTFAVGANETWVGTMECMVGGAISTTGIKVAFTFPSGAAFIASVLLAVSGESAYSGYGITSDTAYIAVTPTSGSFAVLKVSFSVETVGSGNVTLRWAQNTSDVTNLTLAQGSFLKAMKTQ